ncbi:hypothetical protein AVEN_242683-1 [Araneus ventricosus]|uniref:Uncharacterized protein n=1 Tax=Araneus ventricosus TaxID=182803 RepID=A0A4Y2E100_ARAVE|nr:hypothetical protein AVEN_242683-1 [Araneus ventricosus]
MIVSILLLRFNSIDTGPSHTSLQAKDDSRPKHPNVTLKFPPLSLSAIDFHTSGACFLQWIAQVCLGKRGVFLQFGQCQLSWFLREESEFLLEMSSEVPLF